MNVIYKIPGNADHNPEARSWYYDDFGNRVDKKTGDFVIFIQDNEAITAEQQLELLMED